MLLLWKFHHVYTACSDKIAKIYEIVHCATREENWLFLSRMMIEHDWFTRAPPATEWYTSAQNHHPSLKKSVASLLYIAQYLISAGTEPFFAWKVSGRSGISSRHITGDKDFVLPLYCGRPRQTLEMFDFRFTFLRKKGLFHACVEKNIFKIYILNDLAKVGKWTHIWSYKLYSKYM